MKKLVMLFGLLIWTMLFSTKLPDIDIELGMSKEKIRLLLGSPTDTSRHWSGGGQFGFDYDEYAYWPSKDTTNLYLIDLHFYFEYNHYVGYWKLVGLVGGHPDSFYLHFGYTGPSNGFFHNSKPTVETSTGKFRRRNGRWYYEHYWEGKRQWGKLPTKIRTTKGDSSEHVTDEQYLCYKTANSDFFDMKYEIAIEGFEKYLKLYPNTDLSDDAQYFLGLCYTKIEEWQVALTELEKVEKNYPKSENVVHALYEMALCHFKLWVGDNIDQCKECLRRIIKEYPNSVEANFAKEKLNSPSRLFD